MKFIGIIPARGGSKAVPKKNTKLLNRKPLIEYTIESALKAKILDRIIISTDCNEIARISKKYNNVEVIIRPDEISTDTSKTEDALIHVCDELESNGYYADYVLTLEPTSPFRTSKTIIKTIDLIKNKSIDSVVAVVEEKGVLGKIEKERFNHIFPNQPRRRQDRRGIYKEASTIYATSVNILRNKKSVIGNNVYPIVVHGNESHDINDQIDFEIAEIILKKYK